MLRGGIDIRGIKRIVLEVEGVKALCCGRIREYN